MRRPAGRGVRLRPGIVSVMLAVMVPLTLVMTAVLYRQNAALIEQTTRSTMDESSTATVVAIRGLLAPIAHAVEYDAALAHDQPDLMHRPDAWRLLLDQIDQLPGVYSLYVGFQDSGDFLQAVRLPPGIAAFGPAGRKPPPAATNVVRIITADGPRPTDAYLYLGDRGTTLAGIERAPAITFDPRNRPWYEAALTSEGLANSGLYIFSGTGRPGITLSRRVVAADGTLLGVLAADLSTDSLSTFLGQRRIGLDGEAFLVDSHDVVIAYAGNGRRNAAGDAGVYTVASLGDPLVSDAMRRGKAGGGDLFTAELAQTGEHYVASFSRFEITPGETWTLGMIADEDEFAGPLRRASLIILAVGAVALALGALAIFQASRLLTRPIAGLIAETQQIRQLELDRPVAVRSRVTEIAELAAALGAMKHTLHSFGLYVPRELVRDILSRGGEAAVGGGLRMVTVMFTDLADFTRTSEALAPEAVLERLSAYFDAMSRAIHAHHGTIDKFIGDAIMGLWNAPADDPDHAANACLAALACREAAATLNRGMAERGLPPFRTRYGIHSGEAVLGNVGSAERLQYTALGAMVNLASRVEGVNKRFGTEILVTGPTAAGLDERFLLRPLGPVTAAGTTQAIDLFELLGTRGAGSSYPPGPDREALAADWAAPFAAYRRQHWESAAAGLAALVERHPADGVAPVLLARCEAFIDHPPPPDWDGAIIFYAK